MSSIHVSRETCTWGVPNNGIKCRGARDKGRGTRAEGLVTRAEGQGPRGLWRVQRGLCREACDE